MEKNYEIHYFTIANCIANFKSALSRKVVDDKLCVESVGQWHTFTSVSTRSYAVVE